MTTLVTIHCCENGIRVSRITRNGEEVLENVTPAVLELAAHAWRLLSGQPLEGHAALDTRILEVREEVRALAEKTDPVIGDLQRRVASLEQFKTAGRLEPPSPHVRTAQ